ncbi:FAS1 domain-containing protein [Diaporthe sp. PMI_573]|nr:FAS1 domain-containing protein [Diaporthaceae sp. PMI_573]
MHETLAFYLLAMPLSLGRLVLGEIGSHNNLDAFLSSHENVSTFYDIIKQVIINRQSEDEVVFTSGADRRSTLLEGDMKISDGLIQIIDTVMMPPPDLVQICRDYTPLTAFLGALYETKLSEQILTSKEVTIFAPNNAAFQRTSGALSTLSTSELADVMKFHVVPTLLYSIDLVNDTTWPTLDGKNITGDRSQLPMVVLERLPPSAQVSQAQLVCSALAC